MVIFWAALLISAALSVFISLKVEHLGIREILNIIVFFFSSMAVIVEMFKWPLGKRKIDNSKGLAQYIFGDITNPFKEHSVVVLESIISAKTGREKRVVWCVFIGSIVISGLIIYALFFG